MKRIRLSSEEKTVLRMLANGCGCPDSYPQHVFVSAVGSLERKGMAQGVWTARSIWHITRRCGTLLIGSGLSLPLSLLLPPLQA